MDLERIRIAASQAIGHYRAAYHCSPENGVVFSTSQLMLATFSAELAMKALIYKSGQTCKVHELKKLMDKLPPNFKSEIETALRRDWNDYDTQLHNVDKAFVEWRYIFEKTEPMSVNQNFAMRLAELCCLILKREFQIDEYLIENDERRINPLPSIKHTDIAHNT